MIKIEKHIRQICWMQKPFQLLISIITLCMLSGCVATPESVKNQETGEKADIEYEQIQYCKPEEVNELMQEALDLELDNIKLPDTIHMQDASQVSNVMFRYSSDVLERKEELAKILDFPCKEWKVFDMGRENDETMTAEGDSKKDLITVSDNGFVSIMKNNVSQLLEDEFNPQIEDIIQIPLENDDWKERQCNLKDGTCTLGNVVQNIENFFRNDWCAFQPDFEQKVKTILLREEDKQNYLNVTVAQYYKGIPLSTISTWSSSSGIIDKTCASFDILLDSKDEFTWLTNGTGMLEAVKEEAIEEVISPKTAMKFLEIRYTDYREIEIKDIQLVYELTPQGKALELIAPGAEVKAVPYYSFLIERKYEDVGITSVDESTLNYYINVNMLTGEIEEDIDEGIYRQDA